ncbi:ABC transporter substrate-binding protein [Desulforudis sp. 1088]|uniref:ABC transporter substrate-binding protein n=1 Tax=unclassified Candidatus Desulforudis TaxID=2635950 RepID=UPI003BE4123E
MRTKLLYISGCLATLLIAGLAFYFFQQREPAGQIHLRVYESGHEMANLPHYIAASLGYFSDENLAVSLFNAKDDPAAEDLQKAGVVILPPEKAWEKKMHAFAQMTHFEPGFLLAREPMSSFAWSSLKAKIVIGGDPDSTLETTFEAILKKEGLRPQTDVTIVQNLPAKLRLGAFLAGSGNFILLRDPQAQQLQLAEQGYVVASLTPAGNVPAQICAASPGFISRNSEALVRYTRAIARAQSWIAAQNPRDIAVAAASFYPYLDLDTLTAVIERHKENDLWAKTPAIDPKQFAALQEIMFKAGELAKPIPFARVVRPEIAAEALKSLASTKNQ